MSVGFQYSVLVSLNAHLQLHEQVFALSVWHQKITDNKQDVRMFEKYDNIAVGKKVPSPEVLWELVFSAAVVRCVGLLARNRVTQIGASLHGQES